MKHHEHTRKVLAETWPHLFSFPVPLKIAIHKDFPPVGERPITRKRFLRFLSWWCSRPDYVAAIENGRARYGFDGSMHPMVRTTTRKPPAEVFAAAMAAGPLSPRERERYRRQRVAEMKSADAKRGA